MDWRSRRHAQKTHYPDTCSLQQDVFFIDKGCQNGVEGELGRQLELWINSRHKFHTLGFHIAFHPIQRDEVINVLTTGKGDIIAANLTVTPERIDKIDFLKPWLTGVNESLTQDPTSPKLDKLENLAGQEFYVRNRVVTLPTCKF
ncbi:MAG: transporter substrate-binding domain-containing protein [Methylocystis sp.]